VPSPHPTRPTLRIAALLAAIAITATACSQDPVAPDSPTCREGTATLVIFQGPAGHCLPRERVVEYRCRGTSPEIVVGAGRKDERRFLGGTFAARVPVLPPDAQIVGVGEGTQVIEVPGLPDRLYTVRGTDVQRWLWLPPASTVTPGGPDAFMIGDSLLYGGQYAIANTLPGWHLGFDGENGRSSSAGVAIAQTQSALDHDVVVVELGTNDQSATAFRTDATEILAALKRVPLVLWQTVKGPPEVVHADEVNQVIRELAGERGNVAIVDWAGLVKEEELGYDGVHPTAEHEDAMARLVAPMLRQWWSAATATESGCNQG
jgi:lysophospholipase L1-like esterase